MDVCCEVFSKIFWIIFLIKYWIKLLLTQVKFSDSFSPFKSLPGRGWWSCPSRSSRSRPWRRTRSASDLGGGWLSNHPSSPWSPNEFLTNIKSQMSESFSFTFANDIIFGNIIFVVWCSTYVGNLHGITDWLNMAGGMRYYVRELKCTKLQIQKYKYNVSDLKCAYNLWQNISDWVVVEFYSFAKITDLWFFEIKKGNQECVLHFPPCNVACLKQKKRRI